MSLSGKTPAQTYKDLLTLNNSNIENNKKD